VSALDSWLADRRPPPPRDLRSSLRVDDDGGSFDAVLATAARARLDDARSRPGRIRENAFHLLAADALLTYACEAALESEDPEAALLRILMATGQ